MTGPVAWNVRWLQRYNCNERARKQVATDIPVDPALQWPTQMDFGPLHECTRLLHVQLWATQSIQTWVDIYEGLTHASGVAMLLDAEGEPIGRVFYIDVKTMQAWVRLPGGDLEQIAAAGIVWFPRSRQQEDLLRQSLHPRLHKFIAPLDLSSKEMRAFSRKCIGGVQWT